jgi:hypothetical protein
VQPVGQFDEHHPGVPGRRQEEFAQTLQFPLVPFPLLQPAQFVGPPQFGHPVHHAGHLRAEPFLQFLQRDALVLHHVVEEAGRDRFGVHAQFGQQRGDGQRVLDVGLAGPPVLALVGLGGELVGARDQVPGLRAVPDHGKDVVYRQEGGLRAGHRCMGQQWFDISV